MNTMRSRWHYTCVFMVLLIKSCNGGPVLPPKKNATSMNNDLPEQAVKVTSDAIKLKEENPIPTGTNMEKIVNPSILNINVKYHNSTTASNYIVSQETPKETNMNISGVPALALPSGSPPAENVAQDATSAGQASTEGDKQPENKIVENKVNANDTKVTENTELQGNKSLNTNGVNETNIAIQDETKPEGVAEEVSKEKYVSDSGVSPTVSSENDVKSTGSETGNNVSDSKVVTSLDSINNGSIQTEKPSTHSDGNAQPEIKNSTLVSDSNTQIVDQPPSTNSDNDENSSHSVLSTQPDNQKPSSNPEISIQTENKDVSIDSNSNIQATDADPSKINVPVQASEAVGSKANSPSPSSFDNSIKYEDSSATTYQQSFQQFSGSDYDYNSGLSPSDYKTVLDSSDDIFQDDDLPKDDSMPNRNDPVDDEPGPYAKPQPQHYGEFSSDEDSHFFAYFLTIMVTAIVFYLLFHNKQRIIALIIEGRSPRSRRTSRGTRYHKLDNNFEEAMGQTKGSTRFDGLY